MSGPCCEPEADRAHGYGVYLTASVPYFTRAMGPAASQVGIGLTVAGAVALAAAAMTGLCLTRGFPCPIPRT